MSDQSPVKHTSESAPSVTANPALKRVRAATLAAALVPLSHVLPTPVTVTLAASGGSPCDPCTVPEGGSMWPMAAAAALFIGYQLKKTKP